MYIHGVLNKGGNEIAEGIASRQSAVPERARKRSIGYPGKHENHSDFTPPSCSRIGMQS